MEGPRLRIVVVEWRREERRRWKLVRMAGPCWVMRSCFRRAKRGGRGWGEVPERLGKTEEISPVGFGGWGCGGEVK